MLLSPRSVIKRLAVAVLSGGITVTLPSCENEGQDVAPRDADEAHVQPVRVQESWMGGRWLWYRPGNGADPIINPPRFSWPMMAAGLPKNAAESPGNFRFQVASDYFFGEVLVDETTRHNFWSPGRALEPGRYYWRVGYGEPGTTFDHWSAARWFDITADTPKWGRADMSKSLLELAASSHPRLHPPAGNTWEAWERDLQSSEAGQHFLQRLRIMTDKARSAHWWKQMPASDVGMHERQAAEFIKALGWSIFLARLEGKPTPVEAKNALLQVAAYPPGGPSSPEYHGAKQKWSTSIPTSLALGYTLMHDELSAEERRRILEAISWRLEAIYEDKLSWQNPSGDIHAQGVGGAPESHPFQNFYWAMPAVLLTVGDLPVADRLAPIALDYLANVTNAHGADEGWNEAGRYIYEKSTTAMEAAAWTQALLPDERVAGNPFWKGFAKFLNAFEPAGVQRIGFGDYSGDLSEFYTQAVSADAFAFAGMLGGNEPSVRRAQEFFQSVPAERLPRDIPTDLVAGVLAATFSPTPVKSPPSEAADAFRLEKAGWMFLRGRSPDGQEIVAVNTLARPMGGFSHSYAADGSFIWRALGETLVAGGGSTKYPDPFSRASLSHSVPLINGVGQRLSDRWPEFLVAARPVARVDHSRVKGWFADLANAYREPTGPQHRGHYKWMPEVEDEFGGVQDLEGFVRGIFLVDDRWLVIHDELAFSSAEPGRVVSWNLQIQSDRGVTVSGEGLLTQLSFGREKVAARVAAAAESPPLAVQVAPGAEAMINPVTNFDYRPLAETALKQFRRNLADKDLQTTAVRLQLDASKARLGVTAVFDARREDEEISQLPVVTPGRVVFPAASNGITEGKTEFVLGFRDDLQADVILDADATLKLADQTNPERLAAFGEPESIELRGEKFAVQWMLQESFENAESLARWVVETQGAAVSLEDGVLRVRNTPSLTKDGGTTIWLRPEVPQNFLARIRCRTVDPTEGNANNLNFFTNARELDGPLQFGRPGNYPDYHKIPNYTFTFVGQFPPSEIAGWSRIRKNPGFRELAGNMEARAESLTDYEIFLQVNAGKLRMTVNGQTVVEADDAEQLPAGRFGLRTWRSNVDYLSVEIGRILP